jgi:hypothetical protein
MRWGLVHKERRDPRNHLKAVAFAQPGDIARLADIVPNPFLRLFEGFHAAGCQCDRDLPGHAGVEQTKRGKVLFKISLGSTIAHAAFPYGFEDAFPHLIAQVRAKGIGLPEIRVEVEGAGWPDLLVNWLAEQVFCFDVDGFVPNRIDFALCEPTRLEARLRGIAMADPGDTNGTAIKAVTYHQLEVDVRHGRTELRVIFDI